MEYFALIIYGDRRERTFWVTSDKKGRIRNDLKSRFGILTSVSRKGYITTIASLQANLLCPSAALVEAFLWSTMNIKLILFYTFTFFCSRPVILFFPLPIIGWCVPRRHHGHWSFFNKQEFSFINKLAFKFYHLSVPNFDAMRREYRVSSAFKKVSRSHKRGSSACIYLLLPSTVHRILILMIYK
jgi:hypothetical protein